MVQPTVQTPIDGTTLEEDTELARGAVRVGVDWLEAGTTLILHNPAHADQ